MTLIRAAILSVSTTTMSVEEAMPVEDMLSAVVGRLRQTLPTVVIMHQQRVDSQRYWIEEILRAWSDEEEIDLILTIGGTFPAPGPSTAEIVPEASAAVIERLVPALSEAMRMRVLATNPAAVLDRGVSGIRGRTLIVNLPAVFTMDFLDAGIDLFGYILKQLNPTLLPQNENRANSAQSASPAEHTASHLSHKLDETEFAEFLRSRRKQSKL